MTAVDSLQWHFSMVAVFVCFIAARICRQAVHVALRAPSEIQRMRFEHIPVMICSGIERTRFMNFSVSTSVPAKALSFRSDQRAGTGKGGSTSG